jgi:cation:H+ antiporter
MTPLIAPIALLLASALAIYLACEVFVNGVEWVGRKLAVGQQATGAVLAAIGTALPESVVTFVAVAFGASAAQRALGVGAALGGPLVLSTIAYGVVGLSLLASRRPLAWTGETRRDLARLGRDQGWFLVIFVAKIALGLVTFALKPWLGLVFLAAYGAYAWVEMRGGAADDSELEDELEPLTFAPKLATPPAWLAAAQTAGALIVIVLASRVFVLQLDVLGRGLHVRPQLMALLASPIATELPETMNAIIWVRQGKQRLALANISGAMMIQATVPTALGLFYTPWRLDPPLVLAAAVTAAAIATLLAAFRLGVISRTVLAAMSLFYLAFVALLAIAGP